MKIRNVGSIFAVMLLVSACANAPDEEMVVPSLDVTVEMLSETENDDSNTDVICQSIVAANDIEYTLYLINIFCLRCGQEIVRKVFLKFKVKAVSIRNGRMP